MLNVAQVTPGLLFGSFLYNDFHNEIELQNHWKESFGDSFFFSPSLNPLAEYYSKEMGPKESLQRFFAITINSFSRESLLTSKLKAMTWEQKWSKNGLRSVNVDIGFLSLESFILATTKNYSHRVFLGEGIFADLTYQFHQGRLQIFPWTYPDYADEEKLEFFTWARSFLLSHLARSGS